MMRTLYLTPPVTNTHSPSSACGTFCSRRRRPFFFAHPRVCQRDPSPPPQRGRRCRRRMRGTLYLAPPRPKHATPHPPAAPSPSAERRRISTTTPFFFRAPASVPTRPFAPAAAGEKVPKADEGDSLPCTPATKTGDPSSACGTFSLCGAEKDLDDDALFFSRTRECANETLRPRRSGGEGAEGG